MQAEMKTLARDAVLRVAINTGNRALVQQNGSNLTGVSPALERSGTPSDSFEEFRAGRCDAVAGVRASLEGAFAGSPDIRILSSVLTCVRQAMVLPDTTDLRITALNDFVERAIKDGFVEAAQNA